MPAPAVHSVRKARCAVGLSLREANTGRCYVPPHHGVGADRLPRTRGDRAKELPAPAGPVAREGPVKCLPQQLGQLVLGQRSQLLDLRTGDVAAHALSSAVGAAENPVANAVRAMPPISNDVARDQIAWSSRGRPSSRSYASLVTMIDSGERAILHSLAELLTQRPTQAMSLNSLVPTRVTSTMPSSIPAPASNPSKFVNGRPS